MNSLRPTSVCDTTPLQCLESQSSSSEPSSPTLNEVVSSSATSDISGSNGTTSTTGTNNSLSDYKNSTINNNNGISKNNLVHVNPLIDKSDSVKQKMSFNGRREIAFRVLVDGIILSCVGLPILGFHLWGEAYKRGFFCDDISLKHPYRSSTVPSWMLYIMCFIVPTSIIIAVEYCMWSSNKTHGFGNLTAERFNFCGIKVIDWLVECYKKVGLLVFGAGVGQLTTEVAKYSIGRLRPHFFEVCQPIMLDGTTCDDAVNAGRYIEEFTCQGTNVTTRLLKEVRLSFPSGHATFACYTMIYMAIYLQTRMTWQRTKMFKHLLQFLLLMFAWYTSLTRVSDYKHHWTDVLGGSAIGTLYAVMVTSSMW